MERIENMKIKDLMTWGVVTVLEDDTVSDVVRVLVEGNIHAVVVTSGKNEALGVIARIDTAKAFGKDFNKIKAREIMSSPVETISMDKTIKEAAEVMQKKGFNRLIVVDEKKRHRGILSVTDIVDEIMKIMKNKIGRC